LSGERPQGRRHVASGPPRGSTESSRGRAIPGASRALAAAGALAASARLKPRGSSQGGLRQYNERVVLQALRLHGPLPGAEIARLTHLTAQTISLISKRLIDEGLLLKGELLRGKVGQPSVPLALNPDGAYALGIKIGRRSMDVLLVDFTGRTRRRLSLDYDFPDPDTLFDAIDTHLKTLIKGLGRNAASRIQGIGIAAPLSLGGWQTLLGVEPAQAAKWQHIDIGQRVAARTKLPVQLVKDTAAACVAELVAGRGRDMRSFLYIFVDTFIGGGLVIDSHLHAGHHGNAGAVGSMSIGGGGAGGGAMPAQLLGVASLINLEGLYRAQGLDAGALADARALQSPWREMTRAWLGQAAAAIALAVHNAACLLDLEGVIVDGSFGRELLTALLRELDQALGQHNWEGVARPVLLAGTIGSDARAIGGALLPLYAAYAPDSDLFLKLER
jgi:predicted NBD/HSP70 family sugar kinase